ncbi:MAG: DUF5666 domain-containing protein, partial [Casimicrobium sp.]
RLPGLKTELLVDGALLSVTGNLSPTADALFANKIAPFVDPIPDNVVVAIQGYYVGATGATEFKVAGLPVVRNESTLVLGNTSVSGAFTQGTLLEVRGTIKGGTLQATQVKVF